MENKDESTIHKSFSYLTNIINKKSLIPKSEDEDSKDNNDFIKEYFCCRECYNKFLIVINKLKNNKIDLTKIDWGKNSSASPNNTIVKLVTYYYNLGLENSKKY